MDEIRRLEQPFRITKQHKLPQEIKPCVAELLDQKHESDTNDIVFVIALELKRLGRTADNIQNRLTDWNLKNYKLLNPRKIQSTVQSAFKKDYQYGCEGLALYCLYEEKKQCPFYKKLLKSFSTKNWRRDFIKLKWPHHLNNVPLVIYTLVIPELEIRKGSGVGNKVCANYNEIRLIAGISQASIKPGLLELEKAGLIELKIGLRHSYNNTGTEMRRIMPIPRPE